MLEKKELKSIRRMVLSEQQLHDLNTKGRFCIFPDVPVDAADKVTHSHTSTSSQVEMLKVDDELRNTPASAPAVGRNASTLFGSKPENKAWKWGDGLKPSQEIIDHYAAQVPVRGTIALPVAEVFPSLDAGFSCKGNGVTNPTIDNIELNIPPGYKRMTLFNHELQSFCVATVPESTPALTQEEYERFSQLNPI